MERVAIAQRGEIAGEARRGFLAMLPLWMGIVPFALAFAVLARAGGFSALETQALSLFVFAGSAQIAIVTLHVAGNGALAIVLTVLVLNLRHILYGLSLERSWPRPATPPRPLLAAIMTDESYGVAIRDRLAGGGGPAFFAGASLSLYLAFNGATLVGTILGSLIPDPRQLGLDFVFPLTFLALLLPLLRGWRPLLVAAIAGVAALVLARVAAGGVTTLLAAVGAAALGAALEGRGDAQGQADNG